MAEDMNEGRVTTREFYDKLTEVEHRLLGRLDIMSTDIRDLQLSKAALEGKAEQSAVYWAYLIAALGVALSVMALLTS